MELGLVPQRFHFPKNCNFSSDYLLFMTEKKEKILESALELFANQGYTSTATSKIAREAGVSEGLIFRHFGNKAGLLRAIMEEGNRRLRELIAPVLAETDPAAVVQKTIEMPFGVPESEYDFWRLQFKLKWDEEYYNPDNIKPLTEKLVWAFTALNFEDPEMEAQLLVQYNDTIGVDMIRGVIRDRPAFKSFLLKKYEL